MKIINKCTECKKDIIDFRSNKRKYCSRHCYNKSPFRGKRHTTLTEIKCINCSKIFKRHKGNIRCKNQFCSRSCTGKYKEEHGPHNENHPNWRGGYTNKAYRKGWEKIKREIRKTLKNKIKNIHLTNYFKHSFRIFK